ncbi:Uncharacterized protein AC496_0550 [Pseudomonas savastanoi pv. glycinea]|uniref:Uncharacterized protein n=4 Tax=Pseudomonas syringae group genomosp. 2 TaxID=251698 RepID=A0A0Q0GV71_PSEAJ|nr:Uncharacterized protein AC514_2040 [Pseudomonas savastanoi pv. phaseolicola]KPB69472.1 Uncharacterized protein AC508_4940 [Pseudomonas amygdali pv. mellea]KPC30243.1 Uncharacterized protein AC498_3860 [Pseudomonas savastanoi pv. glycinea]KPX93560.1 hypothetical protein ALO63_102045 [Pseudomonas amygdali pv. mori]KPY57205.1 hypothetical protein ALO93_101893 [Pseudomonas amygdali pv. sesami]KPY80870.1 hypothetical protein ALO60_101534 [Pseudomonas amygdali pv. tabaci]
MCHASSEKADLARQHVQHPFQVRINALSCQWIKVQKAGLAAFAMHPQVLDATSLLQIAGLQLRRFL